MAPRSRRPRRARRARRRARKGGKGKLTVSRIPMTVISDKAYVKLPYVSYYNVSVQPYGSGVTQKIFMLNSLYDPEPGVLNHQPLGYDQWSPFYSTYRVFACDYQITLHNLGSDSVVIGGWTPGQYPTLPGDLSAFEQPYTRRFQLGNREGVNKVVIRGRVNMPKVSGLTSVQYKTNPQFAATWVNNPASIVNGFMSLVSSNLPTPVVFSVRLTYHAELFDRNRQLLSGVQTPIFGSM